MLGVELTSVSVGEGVGCSGVNVGSRDEVIVCVASSDDKGFTLVDDSMTTISVDVIGTSTEDEERGEAMEEVVRIVGSIEVELDTDGTEEVNALIAGVASITREESTVIVELNVLVGSISDEVCTSDEDIAGTNEELVIGIVVISEVTVSPAAEVLVG